MMDAQKFNRLIQKIKYDKKAIGEIYEKFGKEMKMHLHWRFGKLIDCEDAMHDVFLKLMEAKIDSYIEYPKTWLHKFAEHCVIDSLRKRRPQEELRITAYSEFNIEDTLIKEDLKAAMQHLDDTSRRILYLHVWEGYGYKEVSEMLDLSHCNVRAIASRAQKKLKPYL